MKTTNHLRTEVEKKLVKEASRGDLDAFNQLVLSYQSLAYHYARTLLWDDDFAEDITQESFIKAFTNIHRFRGGSFRAWLLKIVTNTAYSLLRQSRRVPTQPLFVVDENGDELESTSWLVDPAASVEEVVEQKELVMRLYQMLDDLPPIYRSVITLVDWYEMSYAEVSEILQVPLGTVKSRLVRGRLLMRRKLEPDLEPQRKKGSYGSILADSQVDPGIGLSASRVSEQVSLVAGSDGG